MGNMVSDLEAICAQACVELQQEFNFINEHENEK
jgi:hypothetical protein